MPLLPVQADRRSRLWVNNLRREWNAPLTDAQVVGRNDTTVSGPPIQLPPSFGPGASHDAIFQLFQEKGFSAFDLAALIGAHTTSKAFTEQEFGIPTGTPQDSTPGRWDVTYYEQTYNPPPGVSRFESDINLSDRTTAVGQQFSGFVRNQGMFLLSSQPRELYLYAFQASGREPTSTPCSA